LDSSYFLLVTKIIEIKKKIGFFFRFVELEFSKKSIIDINNGSLHLTGENTITDIKQL